MWVPFIVGQVPAGPPFDPDRHPNPILTFVTDSSFGETGYDDAREQAGVDLMGLSPDQGVRETVALAPGSVSEVEILGRDTDVLFYPVVRQTFRLADGGRFQLYSFRDPRPTEIPNDILADVLNQHAFQRGDSPEESRFGPAVPQELEIRASAALLFEFEGDEPVRVLFWQDSEASHVASAPISRDRMFELVEDLL